MDREEFKIHRSPLMEIFWQDNLLDTFPEHFHTYFVIGSLLRGERILRSGGLIRKLAPGQLLLLNPRQIHQCRIVGRSASSWLALHIPISTMSHLFSQLLGVEDMPIFSSSVMPCGKGSELLQQLCREQSKDSVMRLLAHIQANGFCIASDKKRAAVFPKPISRLCKQLELNLGADIKLGDMAKMTNMDKFSLSKKFKKLVGISPCRYLQVLRLNKAREKLRQGLDISRCAQDFGYHDQSHLNRRFKENFGFTPGYFRKAWLESGLEGKTAHEK